MKYIILSALLVGTYCLYQGNWEERMRGPATAENNRIEFVKWKVDERAEIALIGLENDHFTEVNYDLSQIDYPLVFKSSNTIIPKYLLILLDGKVKDIFSFELEESDPHVHAAMESNGVKRFYFKVDPQKAYFPKRLVDIDYTRRDSILRTLYKIVNSSVYFTTYAPIGIVLNRIFQIAEERKSYQAAYLERLIRLELFEQKVPMLRRQLGERNLWEIASALNLRYHTESEFSAFLTSRAESIDFYQRYRLMQEKDYYENMSKLVQRCNEEGLLAIPITTDFALVYAFNNEGYYKKFNDFLLDIKNPNSAIKALKGFDLDSSQLIPLGVFSARESVTPLTVVDFNRVGQNTREQDFIQLLKDLKEFGFTFLSFSGVSVTLRASELALDFISTKSGSTLLQYRVQSVGEFNLLVDSGIVNFSNEKVLKEALDVQLKNIGLSGTERSKMIENLQTEDKIHQKKMTADIIKRFQDEESERRLFSSTKSVEMRASRYNNWHAFLKYLKKKKKFGSYLSRLKHRYGMRKPASATLPFKEPVVMLLIDGLRPDRFKQAAKNNIMPNLKKYFLTKGHEFNSFVGRSLTLPSWGTIFSGYTSDQHGVRSNNPMRRDVAQAEDSYLDIRKDLLSIWLTGENRSLAHFKESGLKWIADYYDRDRTIMNYMPYSEGLNLPLKKLAMNSVYKVDDFLYGNYRGVLELDRASIQLTREEIESSPGKYQLVMNWVAGVDVHSHKNNDSLNLTYRSIDTELGALIKTLEKDPILKDAYVFLISDHGMRGGKEGKHSNYKMTEEGEFLKNTSLNLTTLLAGDYVDYRKYKFVVKAFKSPWPKHDISFLREFQIHPFHYTYRGKHKINGPVNAMVDTSGDALAQLYFAKPGKGWKQRPDLYDLNHYSIRGERLDLINDLLNLKLKSVVIADPVLREQLLKDTSFHPVEFISTWVKKQENIEQIKKLLSIESELSREPVIVFGRKGKAIILTKRMKGGAELFRYIPLKEIRQTANGTIKLVKGTSHEDILDYSGIEQFSYDNWYTDRQLLQMMSEHNYPNGIEHLARVVTLGKNLKGKKYRESERPDMVLIATPGFNFNSSYANEGDHGGIERAQVKNTLFMTKLGKKSSFKFKESKTPVMGRDILPTVLKINSVNEDDRLWDRRWSDLFK